MCVFVSCGAPSATLPLGQTGEIPIHYIETGGQQPQQKQQSEVFPMLIAHTWPMHEL